VEETPAPRETTGRVAARNPGGPSRSKGKGYEPMGCANAIDRLVEGISAGTIDLHRAKVMLDLVQMRMKAIELGAYEARLIELEKQAGTVEMPGRR
jgi:hypothetical protein